MAKMNNMEIKRGDKVKVSEDAPRMYICGFNHVYTACDSKVLEVDDGNAIIEMTMANMPCQERIIIPTKYLVKVDAEAKEAKFKVNDVVRTVFNETTHITSVLENGNYYLYGMGNEYPEDSLTLIRPYTEPTAPTIKVGDRVRNIESGVIGVVDKIVYENIAWVNGVDGKRYHWKSDELELIEPTEHTEANEDMQRHKDFQQQMADTITANKKRREEYIRFMEGCMSGGMDFSVADSPESINGRIRQAAERTKTKGDALAFPIAFDLTDCYWDAYAADLAKELALKVTNKFNDPREAAEYAVSVAKAVVDGLKRKCV